MSRAARRVLCTCAGGPSGGAVDATCEPVPDPSPEAVFERATGPYRHCRAPVGSGAPRRLLRDEDA